MMRSIPTLGLGGILFAIAMIVAYTLDLIFGPVAVVLLSVAIIGVGLYLRRDWMTYAGGLVICAGLAFDVALDTVQTGSFFVGVFAVIMLGAVGVCSVISADKMQSNI
jgi:hypothetical protein